VRNEDDALVRNEDDARPSVFHSLFLCSCSCSLLLGRSSFERLPRASSDRQVPVRDAGVPSPAPAIRGLRRAVPGGPSFGIRRV
jgi:hypothetical protein